MNLTHLLCVTNMDHLNFENYEIVIQSLMTKIDQIYVIHSILIQTIKMNMVY